MKMKVASLVILFPATLALNILLTSTNSWVSKNIRFLQEELESQNHNVVLVAPLYNTHSKIDARGNVKKISRRDVDLDDEAFDGGEFGHLLPVHQTYYNNVRSLGKGAKGVIREHHADEEKSDAESKPEEEIFHSKSFGQDPSKPNAWYVNNSPTTALLIAYDIILPKFYPNFKPDLIIVGPNEGVSLTGSAPSHKRLISESISPVEEMAKLSMIKNIPTISISTEDSDNIYFQDETYFQISQNPLNRYHHRGHRNRFAKNIHFINNKVTELINSLTHLQSESFSEKLLPNKTSLNINFPSMNNGGSYCFTSKKNPELDPKFNQIVFVEEEHQNIVKLPSYVLTENGDLILEGEYSIDLETTKKVSRPDHSDDTYFDTDSYYYRHKAKTYANEDPHQDYSDNEDFTKLVMRNDLERLALRDCSISVSVNNLDSNGLGKDYFDLKL